MTRIATAILIALIALVACTEPVPTATHAPAPTVAPTATPEPEPTVVPTPKPTSTPKPTVTPWPTSTPKPTATPEPEVSPARYCEWFFDEVRIAQWKNDDERAINAGDRVAHALGTNPDTLWDYCEDVPTVSQILAYTGRHIFNGSYLAGIECRGTNTMGCLVAEAIHHGVELAEKEMLTDLKGYSSHSTFHVECFLIAKRTIEDSKYGLCSLNHPELKRFDGPSYGASFLEEPYAEFYYDRLDDVADELLNFLNFLDGLPHDNLYALSERDKELLQSIIDRVYSEWEKFKAAHEQMVCQYIVCE